MYWIYSTGLSLHMRHAPNDPHTVVHFKQIHNNVNSETLSIGLCKSKSHHQSTSYAFKIEWTGWKMSNSCFHRFWSLNIPPLSILDSLCGCIWFFFFSKCDVSENPKETNTLNKTMYRCCLYKRIYKYGWRSNHPLN